MVSSLLCLLLLADGYARLLKLGDGISGDFSLGCNQELHTLIHLGTPLGSLSSIATVLEAYDLVEVLGNVGTGVADLTCRDGSLRLGLSLCLLITLTRLGVVIDVHGLLVCIVLLLECKEHTFEVFVSSIQALVSVT